MSEESTSIKLPTFKGEKELYQKFKLRFRAYANAKGFLSALSRDNIPKDSTDNDTEEKKLFIKANNNAVSAYTLALEGDQVFQMITSAMNSDWPEGLAVLIGEKLDKQYQPSDLISEVEMETDLLKVSMSLSESPVVLFNKLASIKIAYSKPGKVIADSEFFSTIIRQAPDEYDAGIQDVLAAKGSSCTLDDIQTKMLEKFRYMQAKAPSVKEASGNKSPVETGLVGLNDDGSQVTCYVCGQKGHKANNPNCPKRRERQQKQGQNGKRKFKGKCHKCGVRGHMSSDCWEREENASKRPANWVSE